MLFLPKASKTVDYIVEGFDRAKAAIIITARPDQICDALSRTFECSMTRIEARGGYSGTARTMIYFIVNRFQVAKMKDMIQEIDPSAYITISEVADVFAANFDIKNLTHKEPSSNEKGTPETGIS